MATEAFKFPDEVDMDGAVQDVIVEDDIEIIDDTPERDRGRKPLAHPVNDPTDDELAAYSGDVKKRINDLTHARHSERREKESAQREREEATRVLQQVFNENQELKKAINNGSRQFVDTARYAADTQLDVAKRNFKAAFETGDPDAITEAQSELMSAQMRAQSAKNFSPTALQVNDPVVQNTPATQQAPELDEKTLRWQARNQWFGNAKSKAMTSYALGLHQELVESGVDPRSDEYFEQIDSHMRSTFRDFFGTERTASGNGASRHAPATVVASAARSVGTRRIRLTSTQLALAKHMGITPQQYAQEVAKLEKSNG